MAKTNRWKTYKVSKSLNGNKIVYLARAGKNKKIIGRAGSASELAKIMAKEAKQFDDEQAEILKLAEEKEAKKVAKEAKKPGLWKPGGALRKKDLKSKTTVKSTSKLTQNSVADAIKAAKAKKTSSSKKVNVTTESL